MDFRDPFVKVEESASNVTLCVYICDGKLRRNASITFATEDAMATCELHKYIHAVQCIHHAVNSHACNCLFMWGKLVIGTCIYRH